MGPREAAMSRDLPVLLVLSGCYHSCEVPQERSPSSCCAFSLGPVGHTRTSLCLAWLTHPLSGAIRADTET